MLLFMFSGYELFMYYWDEISNPFLWEGAKWPKSVRGHLKKYFHIFFSSTSCKHLVQCLSLPRHWILAFSLSFVPEAMGTISMVQ